MISSSIPTASGATTNLLAAEIVDQPDAPTTSYRIAQRDSHHTRSEGLCARDGGPAAAAAATSTGGGAETHYAAAAARKSIPHRRNVDVEGLGICDTAEARPAETYARCVFRPIFIRSLDRQKKLNAGVVLDQVAISPSAARKPATDKPPRRVVVAQGSPRAPAAAAAAAAATAGALCTARTAGTSGSEVDQRKTANNNEGRTGRDWYQCGWARRILGVYSDALETRPLTFKCATSALVGGFGDVAAQAVSWAIRGGDVVWYDAKAVRKTLAVAIDGFCVNAPFLHFAYDALDRWLPTEESTTNAVVQVLVDVFVINPFYAVTFIATTGLLEGKSVHGEIIPTIRQDYATMVFWLVVIGLVLAPPHVFLFKRFPLKWRVLIADAIDLLWTFVACFIIGPR